MYVEEEIRRIQLEAIRKERNLIAKFDQLKSLAKEALFHNLESGQDNGGELEKRVEKFESVIGNMLARHQQSSLSTYKDDT